MTTQMERKTTARLSDKEMEKIYRIRQRFYWEMDFISRCRERKLEEIGLCNLPYQTLPEEKKLLDLAYELYNNMEDSNTAYNVTLDLVIDEIERRIQDNRIVTAAEPPGNPRVVIIIEDGIVSTVLASDPDIQIDIIELDRNYADSELRSSTYDAALKEPGLQNCSYSLHVPGYEQEMETEVDE
ncbi:hypothetical protein AALB51_17210 [Lachnospiraceae bacterium 62-26]|uniref:hypothetical protein n=1 Tax=Lachnospiraceae TaxID=186803 RepID=UPI002557CB10|nr:hypothetical protein [Schaedlerella arabinosiphila]